MTKYFALYDTQLSGYKAGHASTCYKEVLSSGAERAFELSQNDEEPCTKGLTDEEILEQYDYEVHEVSKEDYEVILNSDEVGLMTSVKL